MKANELRVGNLCYFNDKIQLGQTFEVIKILGVLDYGIISEQYGNTKIANFEDYFYIPLTEEWLLKFGFELDYGNFFKYEYFSIQKHKDEYLMLKDDKILTVLYYVHQLQNLYFALTNQELTISQK